VSVDRAVPPPLSIEERVMKNVWKGLIVGALTGAGIGLLLDLLEALGRGGRRLSIQARDEAVHLASVAEAKVKDAEVGERASHVAEVVADKVKDTDLSDLRDRAAQAAGTVADKVKDTEVPDAAHRVAARVRTSDLAQRAAETVSPPTT
jgi:hypothetical protein